jgi:excisionase family DNA binding protein
MTPNTVRPSRKRQPIPIEPLAYTIDETCVRLRISRTKLYAEIAAGEIETFTIGDRRLITPEAQLQYLARKQERVA